jgi:hypothetical protein
MGNLRKTLTVLFTLLLCWSVPSFAEDPGGTGWIFEEEDGDKTLLIFDWKGTVTYLNLRSRFNQGNLYNDPNDTWNIVDDKVIISFTGGYKICSLTFDGSKDRMSGTCINKQGKVEKVTGRLIK